MHLLRNEDKIIKIQSSYRGYLSRKKGALVNKEDNEEVEGSSTMCKSSTSEVTFKEEHVFDNGAVYRGQWKAEMRHGYGV